MNSPANELPIIPLSSEDVHLWFAFPDNIRSHELLEKYRSIMDEDETEKCGRYKFEHSRHTCLITRALARSVLSRYAEKTPAEWRFSKNKHGKPEIIHESSSPPLRFNLSHSKGLIACAVTMGHDVGVDVENINDRPVNLDVADRFFSPAEVNDLSSFPHSEQEKRFFDYWTLKESYVKARGKGLSFHLDQFSFLLAKNRPLGISFDSGIRDNPDQWKFFRIKPTVDHIAAISVHSKKQSDFKLTVMTATPLVDEKPLPCEIL